MKKYLLVSMLVLSLTLPPAILAKDGDDHQGDNPAKIENENQEIETEPGENHNLSTPVPGSRVEIHNNQFEVSGTIDSISGNSFVAAGQTIIIDPTQVSEFEQKGVLTIGNRVKVEGVIVNGADFAREITVLGTGQGELKVEVKNVPSASPPNRGKSQRFSCC